MDESYNPLVLFNLMITTLDCSSTIVVMINKSQNQLAPFNFMIKIKEGNKSDRRSKGGNPNKRTGMLR
jgi:hypothetical protein